MAEIATIARPYADALFKAAGADAAGVASWLDELAAVAGNEQLRQFAEAPQSSPTQVFDVITGGLFATVSQLIFDGGRTRAQVRNAEAVAQGSLAAWRQSILSALEEVESAAVDLKSARERVTIQNEALDAANNAAILARILSLNPAIYEDIQFGNPHAHETLTALHAQIGRMAALVGEERVVALDERPGPGVLQGDRAELHLDRAGEAVVGDLGDGCPGEAAADRLQVHERRPGLLDRRRDGERVAQLHALTPLPPRGRPAGSGPWRGAAGSRRRR